MSKDIGIEYFSPKYSPHSVEHSSTYEFFCNEDPIYKCAADIAKKRKQIKEIENGLLPNCEYVDMIIEELHEQEYEDKGPEIKGLQFVKDKIQNTFDFNCFEVERVEKLGEQLEWRSGGSGGYVFEEFLTEEIKPGDKYMETLTYVEDEEYGHLGKRELYKFENGEYKTQPCYVDYELPKEYQYDGNTYVEDTIRVTRAINKRGKENRTARQGYGTDLSLNGSQTR